jgi:hypothetical protein
MPSIFSQAGFLSNDNRASGGQLEEDDILGCSHCQALIRKSEWKIKGGYCYQCDQPLCLPCAEKAKRHGCANFKRQIDQQVEQAYRRDRLVNI